MDPRYNTYHIEGNCIVDGFGAILYEAFDPPLSDEAMQRLVELHTEHPDWDWETASQILIEEGLIDEV